jgi:hypothetical protein
MLCLQVPWKSIWSLYYFTNVVEIYALVCWGHGGAFTTLFLVFGGCPLSSMTEGGLLHNVPCFAKQSTKCIFCTSNDLSIAVQSSLQCLSLVVFRELQWIVLAIQWGYGEPAMPALYYNIWRWEQSDQKTSWCHFSSVDVAPQKRLCTFFCRINPTENIVNTGVLEIFHMKNQWDIENFPFDVKLKQVG